MYNETDAVMSRFIVFGNSNYNTLGVVRGLRNRPVECFLLLVSISRFNAVTLSKGVKEYKRVKNEDYGISFLMDRKNIWKGAVIFPTSDLAEQALDAHFNELKGFYYFPHAGRQNAVGAFLDKQLQVKLASASGLHVPISFRHKRGEVLSNDIVFPCIVKPQNSTTGKKGIMHICHNSAEVQQAEEAMRHADDFLLQQYIDKEYELLLIGCRLPNGQVWLPGIFQKKRWYLRGGDASYGLITTQVDELFSQQMEVGAFLDKLGYYGPFSIEFGVEDNTPYFYEINLRNDGTSHYFYKAGICIPYIFYLANTNVLKEADLVVPKVHYTFIDEFGDIVNVRETRLSFRQWWHDLRYASAYKIFQAGDMKPFLAMMPRRVIALLYRSFKSN